MRVKALFVFLFLLVPLAAACNTARNAGSTAKDATVTAGKEVGDKTEDVAEATADVAKAGASKTAEMAKKGAAEVEDGSITAAIKTKFARSDLVDASDINIDTDKGRVILRGTVSSKAEEQKAISLAKEVAGVKSVTSELKMKSGSSGI